MRQLVDELDALLVDPNGVYGVITETSEHPAVSEPNISFRQNPEYDKISEIEKSAEAIRLSRYRDNILLALIIKPYTFKTFDHVIYVCILLVG